MTNKQRYTFKIIVFLLLSLLSSPSYSQGFDWVYSSRLPFELPNTYYGLNLEYGVLSEYLDITLSEVTGNKEYNCCRFNEGTGKRVRIGGLVEYWYNSSVSLNLSIGYQSSWSRFLHPSEPLPLRSGGKFQTEYSFKNRNSSVNLEVGARYKILESHFFVAPSFLSAYSLNNVITEVKEEIILPEDEVFSDGLSYRFLPKGNLPEKKNLSCFLNLKVGYDYPLQNGIYLSSYLSYSLQLNKGVIYTNSGIDDTMSFWRTNSINLGMNLLFSL